MPGRPCSLGRSRGLGHRVASGAQQVPRLHGGFQARSEGFSLSSADCSHLGCIVRDTGPGRGGGGAGCWGRRRVRPLTDSNAANTARRPPSGSACPPALPSALGIGWTPPSPGHKPAPVLAFARVPTTPRWPPLPHASLVSSRGPSRPGTRGWSRRGRAWQLHGASLPAGTS